MTKEEYLAEQNIKKEEAKLRKENKRPKIYKKEKLHKRNHECISHLNKITLVLDEKNQLDFEAINLLELCEAKGYNTETLDAIDLHIEHNIMPIPANYKFHVISDKGTKAEITCVVKKARNKYNNKKVVVEDIPFDSKKEANHYLELKALEDDGKINGLELQKVFMLIPKQADERPVTYVADFYYKTTDGQEIVEDTKGWRTSNYIIKRKMFKYFYPNIIFTEI